MFVMQNRHFEVDTGSITLNPQKHVLDLKLYSHVTFFTIISQQFFSYISNVLSEKQ